jgi:hypothetical protein
MSRFMADRYGYDQLALIARDALADELGTASITAAWSTAAAATCIR